MYNYKICKLNFDYILLSGEKYFSDCKSIIAFYGNKNILNTLKFEKYDVA